MKPNLINWNPTDPSRAIRFATACCILLFSNTLAIAQSEVKLSNPILNNGGVDRLEIPNPHRSSPLNSSQPQANPRQMSPPNQNHLGVPQLKRTNTRDQFLLRQPYQQLPSQPMSNQKLPGQQMPGQRVLNQQLQSPKFQQPQQQIPRFNVPTPRIPRADSPEPAVQHRSSPRTPAGQTQTETIRERYDDGKLRVERQVIQNEKKDYINHGFWKYYLPNGRVSAQAFFDQGKKSGAWSRWVTPKEAGVFKNPPFNQFRAPYLSTFHYVNDQLNGLWKISDSANRKILEITLRDGKRHSQSTWYLPNGQKFQQINYRDGLMHGQYLKWNLKGQLVEDRKFEQGQEIGHITEFHRPGVKRLEYGVLAGKVEAVTLDDPWNIVFAVEEKIAPDIKHGPIAAWYSNGQMRFSGNYKHDVQDGEFIWYYSTGQKQAVGQLVAGQRTGDWIWWHENGMRASAGQYVSGAPGGAWQWWLANGKLSRAKDFGESSATQVSTEGDTQTMKNASFKNNDSK